MPTRSKAKIIPDFQTGDSVAWVWPDNGTGVGNGPGTHDTIFDAFANGDVDTCYLMPGEVGEWHGVANGDFGAIGINRHFALIGMGTASKIKIRGFGATPTTANMFSVTGATDFEIVNCSLQSCLTGVVASGTGRVTLTRAWGEGAGAGGSGGLGSLLSCADSRTDLVVQNCLIVFASGDGLDIDDCQRGVCENNNLILTTGSGIDVAGGTDVSISGNTFFGGSPQLFVSGGDKVISRNNTYDTPSTFGIELNGLTIDDKFESQSDVIVKGPGHINLDASNILEDALGNPIYQFKNGSWDEDKVTIGTGQIRPQNFVGADAEIYVDTVKAVRDLTVGAGTNAITIGKSSSGWVTTKGTGALPALGTRTVNVGTFDEDFMNTCFSLINTDKNSDTATIDCQGVNSLIVGACSLFRCKEGINSSVVLDTADASSSGIILGTAYIGLSEFTGASVGWSCESKMQTTQEGCVIMGVVGNSGTTAAANANFNIDAAMIVSGRGSINAGVVLVGYQGTTTYRTTTGTDVISTVSGEGSMSVSLLSRGLETVSGSGSLSIARWDADCSFGSRNIILSGNGSLSVLSNDNGFGASNLSGNGSVVVASFQDGASGNVFNSGDGSMILSTILGTTANNSGDDVFMLGATTNTQSDCLVLASAMRLKINTTAFTTPQDGDIRQDASGNVRIHSEGYDTTVFSDYIATETSASFSPSTQRTILCDTSSNAITITLPTAASNFKRRMTIKLIDATNAVTVDGQGSDTIDGSLTQVITGLYDSMELVCDGTEWWII